jgi:hypothetical protein
VGSVDDDTVFDASSFSEGGQDSLEQGVKGEGLGGLRKSRVERWCRGAEELPFEDAYVSVNAATTVVGLMPHTLYAFRVRVSQVPLPVSQFCFVSRGFSADLNLYVFSDRGLSSFFPGDQENEPKGFTLFKRTIQG